MFTRGPNGETLVIDGTTFRDDQIEYAIAAGLNGAINVKAPPYSAKGDGLTDDTAAFQAALNAGSSVYVPPGDYLIAGALTISSGIVLYGNEPGQATGADYASYPDCARLIFTGTNTSCFRNPSPTTGIYHGAFANLTLIVPSTASRSWIFDFDGLLGWHFENVRADNQSGGGVLRSEQITSGPTWLNRVVNCEFRAEDSASAYVVDIKWSDSDFTGTTTTGGLGVMDRGPGNVRYLGHQFERSGAAGAGLTLSKEASSNKEHLVVGSTFDANVSTGLLIDVTNSPGGDVCAPVIAGCAFRNPGATNDVKLLNPGATVMRGGIIDACSFSSTGVTAHITYDSAKWSTLDIGRNFYNTSLALEWQIKTGSTIRARWTSDGGQFRPEANESVSFGGPSNRWANMYTKRLNFGPYTVAQLPAASSNAGVAVYVSDGDSGSKCLAVSDGTSWRRVPLGAAVSAS